MGKIQSQIMLSSHDVRYSAFICYHLPLHCS